MNTFDWIPTIETERLILREKTPEIFHRIFTEYDDDEQMDFFQFDSKEKLAKEKNNFKLGYASWSRTIHMWDIFVKSGNGNLIGDCGFHTIHLRHDRAELGYKIHQEEQKRKGYMSEAVKAILRFGFQELKLHRVEAYISPDNIPSQKIARKFGFTEEGLLRKDYLFKGVYESSIVFGLLREDWK